MRWQIYIGGEFVGGADVAQELAESGELQVSGGQGGAGVRGKGLVVRG